MPYLLLFGSVALGAGGQVALKLGVGGAASLLSALLTPLVWLGLGLYGLSAILWMGVLRTLDLSFAYPFASLTYPLVMILSYVVLKEPLVWTRLVGTLVVLVGILIIARGG